MRCYGMAAVIVSKMSHIPPLGARVRRFGAVPRDFMGLTGRQEIPLRQGRRAWLIVSALVAVCAAAPAAFAQGRAGVPTGHQTEAVDLNEGKSPAELFKAGCAVCHQSVAPLGKGRSARELTGFLRQHYTSSSQHAAALAGFVAANGRSAPAGPAATPARLNPNAPATRPPAPVGREEEHRKPQEAARPPEREPAAKRRPPERHPAAAKPVPPPPPATAAAPPPPAPVEAPAAAAAPAPEPAPAAPAPAAEAPPSAPPPPAAEEKPAAGPDIPL